MIDYQRIFHTGIRVPSITAAMDELGESLGVTWAELVETEQAVWTPDGGAETVGLKFVYSAEGPQHIELLEGAPGSIWDGRGDPGVHHVGVWVSDVAAETERLIRLGWELAAASAPPDEGYGGFTYVVPPNGTIVELVIDAIEPVFEQWWAGGSLR